MSVRSIGMILWWLVIGAALYALAALQLVIGVALYVAVSAVSLMVHGLAPR